METETAPLRVSVSISFKVGTHVVAKLLSKTSSKNFTGDEYYRGVPADGAKQYRLLDCRAGGQALRHRHDRDIALRVTGAKRDPDKTKVKDIMTPDPIRISVDKDLHHLTELMHAYNVRRVPIVNGFDTTLGIVTLDDLIALFGEEMSEIGKAISEEFPRGDA